MKSNFQFSIYIEVNKINRNKIPIKVNFINKKLNILAKEKYILKNHTFVLFLKNFQEQVKKTLYERSNFEKFT